MPLLRLKYLPIIVLLKPHLGVIRCNQGNCVRLTSESGVHRVVVNSAVDRVIDIFSSTKAPPTMTLYDLTSKSTTTTTAAAKNNYTHFGNNDFACSIFCCFGSTIETTTLRSKLSPRNGSFDLDTSTFDFFCF